MAVFHDLTSTSTSLDPGFTYADFSSNLEAAIVDLDTALWNAYYYYPYNTATDYSTYVLAEWSSYDYGDLSIYLEGKFSNTSSAEVTFSSIVGNGAYLNFEGSMKVDLDTLEVTDVSLSDFSLGSDDVALILQGNMKSDFVTVNAYGTVSTQIMAVPNTDTVSNPYDWNYVKLIGSVKLESGGTVSGKVTGFEWGTAEDSGGGMAFTPAGSMSGLKIDAAVLYPALESGGFDALMDGLYAGNDTIDGTEGDDWLESSTGNDKVYGEGGSDHIDGGAGNDKLFGDAGDDTLIGGAGKDKIEAGTGNNTVNAGAGNDKVTTGAGSDRINGGEGADKLSGGTGVDVFVFDNLGVGGFDKVADFSTVDGDSIELDASVFTSLFGDVTADNLIAGEGFSAALDADDYLIFNSKSGALYYDADANGGGAAVQIAVLKGMVVDLSADDFSVVI